MREIVLHLLDLAENSVSAGAGTIRIGICEDLDADRLTVSLADDGCGMDPETVRKVADPFYTGRTTRNVGLGIPLLKEAAETANGGMTIHSQPGAGTTIQVSFQHSHIDRMPLGNLAETFRELSVAHPEVHWIDRYTARKDGAERTFEFDDQPVKEILADVPLTHPDVLAFLRETLEQGLGEAQSILEPASLQEK
ncbi:MAG TPA: ATP-binding protein [Anaerolineales bacterium]|nr:ATP-binding protein [Anaerolineales bacterium]